MHGSAVSLLMVAASLAQYGPAARFGAPVRIYSHGAIQKEELEQQQQAYKQWWGDDLTLKLADLPTEGKVPDFRVPYAGHDYPDRAGGTVSALYKYDQAFHRSRPLAADFERMDVTAHREAGGEEREVRGPFGRIRIVRGRGVPTWYGHCNGWTAAAIRHAEPQKSVVRNGVTFTPADIKGLLAELYMYTDTEFLGGVDPAINPGILHLTLANWLGRGSHPVGMETAVGEVVINFPVFNYKSAINKYSPREAEVRTTITYVLNINREMDKGPANYHRQLYFHYVVELDESGAIRGGRFYGDSGQIDMLWTPLQPTQGGTEKNQRGNPHLNVKDVLALWRESVPEDLRKKWLNVDPTDEDRVLPPTETLAATEKPAEKPGEKSAEGSIAATTVTEPAPASGDAASATAAASASAASSDSASAPRSEGSTEPPAGNAAPTP
jgi:Transglutaminase elicitor